MKEDPLELGNIEKTIDEMWEGFRDPLIRPLRSVEALDQGLGTRIDAGIEPLVRVSVAREKAFEPQHVGVIGSADDYRSAGAAPQQPNATRDQGPHDPFAELGFLDNRSRSLRCGITRTSTGSLATPSTSAGRPDSWASSPMNDPGPWLTIGSAS
jgi:hypothetical protein